MIFANIKPCWDISAWIQVSYLIWFDIFRSWELGFCHANSLCGTFLNKSSSKSPSDLTMLTRVCTLAGGYFLRSNPSQSCTPLWRWNLLSQSCIRPNIGFRIIVVNGLDFIVRVSISRISDIVTTLIMIIFGLYIQKSAVRLSHRPSPFIVPSW